MQGTAGVMANMKASIYDPTDYCCDQSTWSRLPVTTRAVALATDLSLRPPPMAGRILRRATALGIAAAAAGSLHAVATWKPPELIANSTYSKKDIITFAPGLQAALLRCHPLSGAHLRRVRTQAEKDLALADAEGAEGDPAAAADLRLLLALLAARDGLTQEALRLYADAARDTPFDPRPRVLAFYLCVLAGRVSEAVKWWKAYLRVVPAQQGKVGYESPETKELINELLIAATLGGVRDLAKPEKRAWPESTTRVFLMKRACQQVDAGLVAALQDTTLSTAERLQLRALRVYLHAKVRLLVKE